MQTCFITYTINSIFAKDMRDGRKERGRKRREREELEGNG